MTGVPLSGPVNGRLPPCPSADRCWLMTMTQVRRAYPYEIDALIALWLRSVRATHTFLGEVDIQSLLPLVRDDVLPVLELWVWTQTTTDRWASWAWTTPRSRPLRRSRAYAQGGRQAPSRPCTRPEGPPHGGCQRTESRGPGFLPGQRLRGDRALARRQRRATFPAPALERMPAAGRASAATGLSARTALATLRPVGTEWNA